MARGNKARNFRRNLDVIAAECALKQTAAAGGARPLALEAIKEGFDTIIAAGGDGTLNEVLNGIGDAPNGFQRARLGVLPLGTVNVFAKELGIPSNLKKAWDVIRFGHEILIDLPKVEFVDGDQISHRYFAQLAGSGLDARAIELVDWELKKKVGPLAYVVAGFQAMTMKAPSILAKNGENSASGELVLVGNGRFYGGKFALHPEASMQDGLLDVRVFKKTDISTLFQCAGMFLGWGQPPAHVAPVFHADHFTLTGENRTPLEVDGENIGHLPATFSLEKKRLRVIAPSK